MGRIKLPSNGVNNDPNFTERVNYHILGLINVRSIKCKDQALLNYALEHKFDAIIIT